MTTLYNASKYIKRCIDSVKNQTITEFKMIITNDMSTDNSEEIVKDCIKDDNRFILINNFKKMYQPGNYYQISKMSFIDDDDILVTLDGDDWFPDEHTLSRILGYYNNTSCLMTFGQFLEYRGENSYANGFTGPVDFNNIRGSDWTTSHLRTFKAKVFRCISEDDLKAPNGNYWEVTGDQAIIYPMLEMCGSHNVHFTQDINYIYNTENTINDFKVNLELQRHYSLLIKNKLKYEQRF